MVGVIVHSYDTDNLCSVYMSTMTLAQNYTHLSQLQLHGLSPSPVVVYSAKTNNSTKNRFKFQLTLEWNEHLPECFVNYLSMHDK